MSDTSGAVKIAEDADSPWNVTELPKYTYHVKSDGTVDDDCGPPTVVPGRFLQSLPMNLNLKSKTIKFVNSTSRSIVLCLTSHPVLRTSFQVGVGSSSNGFKYSGAPVKNVDCRNFYRGRSGDILVTSSRVYVTLCLHANAGAPYQVYWLSRPVEAASTLTVFEKHFADPPFSR